MVTVSNIVNASRGELLCITYELLLEQIELAIKSEEIEERVRLTQKAIKILQMLVGDLDFTIELSKELFRIYVYVQGQLIKGKKETEALKEAYKLIQKIYEGYKKITKEEECKKPVMQNTETIYAGLTYGRETLNEMAMGEINRGFKA
ncbi:MAG: hypothetical protein E7231_07305 [Cellulosilyticum sp.]|nr:hypothetical protein [Cellulosilyticum sp.]